MAQILSCGAAALSTVGVSRLGESRRKSRVALPALTFFAAAFFTRYLLQDTESRLQIGAFAIATVILERLRSRSVGGRFSVWRWGCNAIAAAGGVLLAKHILEPGAISFFILAQLNKVGIEAPSWLVPND